VPQALPGVHVLVRVCLPAPHSAEHALQAPNSPIRAFTMEPPHDRVSDIGPEHCVPQAFPGVHVRLRDCVPRPHEVEQALHAPKAPMRALTIGPPHDLDSDKASYVVPHGMPQAFPGIHTRVLLCTPRPHDVEQALHGPKAPIRELTIGLPHVFDSVVGPLQGLPQGSFFIQDRLLVIVPRPHFTEHALQGPNAPILPCTTGFPQDLDSDEGPLHGAPHELPLTHVRVRV